MRIARYGTVVHMQNRLTQEQIAQRTSQLAASLTEIERGIQEHVDAAVQIVRQANPLELLQRGYWGIAMVSLDSGPEESKVGPENLTAMRMLDYVQKLVVAVGSNDASTAAIRDSVYADLKAHVEAIFMQLIPMYFVARTAALRGRADYDHDRDSFRVQAEMIWAMVRGDRYSSHDVIHHDELLNPHDEAFRHSFGVDVVQLVDGISAIQQGLMGGPLQALRELESLRRSLVAEALARKIITTDQQTVPQALGRQLMTDLGWANKANALAARAFGTHAFDVGLNTGWPDDLLLELSATPGEDRAFIEDRRHPGWPTRPSATGISSVTFFWRRFQVSRYFGARRSKAACSARYRLSIHP